MFIEDGQYISNICQKGLFKKSEWSTNLEFTVLELTVPIL